MSTTAFAISAEEMGLIEGLNLPGPSPRLDKGLLRLQVDDVPDLLRQIAKKVEHHEWHSDECRVALRLSERLGAWLGRRIVLGQDVVDSLLF